MATAAAAPDTAGLTGAYAAAASLPADQDTEVFHGLFSDSRRAPVAAVVSQLWGVAKPAPGAPPAAQGGIRNLFSDSESGT
jgi:hypothetical protein